MMLVYMETIHTLLLVIGVIATAAGSCVWTNITFEGGKIHSVNSDAVASVSNNANGSYADINWRINETVVAQGRCGASCDEVDLLSGNATFQIDKNNFSSTIFLMRLPFEYDGADLSISDDRCVGNRQTTKMHVRYCSASEQRDAFNQHAIVDITASSDKPAYKDKGKCSCGEGSVFFSNGTESSGDVWCNGNAQWEGCENVQCWSAPSVIEVSQNQTFAGLPANLSCSYTVGFPNNTKELFYISDIKVDRAVTLNSSHYLQEYYCKAENEYTNVDGKEPSSDKKKLVVHFEPENLSEVSKIYEIQILINDSKNVTFSFRANDADDNVTATFHQLGGYEFLTPVSNTSDNKTAYHCFSYNINVNNDSDYGEYIFIARTSRPPGSLNTTIKVVAHPVTTTPITTTSGRDDGTDPDPPRSNTLAIAAGCGAAGIAIIVLVVALIIYRRRKGKDDTEPDIKEERENPLYGSTPGPPSNDEYASVDRNKKKKKKEKEEKVNPLYQGTPTNENMVEDAYAAIDKKAKKGNTGNENSAFADEVTYAAVNKPKKGKKAEPQPDVVYSAVQKKTKTGQRSDDGLHS